MPPRELPAGLDIYYESPAVRASAWRDVFFDVWLGNGTVRDLRAIRTYQEARLRKSGLRFASIAIIRVEQLRAFDDEMRREMEIGRQMLNQHQKCAAVVMQQTGFTSSVVRGVLAGLMLLRREKFPHRVFENVEDAMRWTVPQLDAIDGRAPTFPELAAVYASLNENGSTRPA